MCKNHENLNVLMYTEKFKFNHFNITATHTKHMLTNPDVLKHLLVVITKGFHNKKK